MNDKNKDDNTKIIKMGNRTPANTTETKPAETSEKISALPPGISQHACKKCNSPHFTQVFQLFIVSKLNPKNSTGKDQLMPTPGFLCVNNCEESFTPIETRPNQ
jgi:hypothetical protein